MDADHRNTSGLSVTVQDSGSETGLKSPIAQYPMVWAPRGGHVPVGRQDEDRRQRDDACGLHLADLPRKTAVDGRRAGAWRARPTQVTMSV